MNDWISVDDRLPDERVEVLISVLGPKFAVAVRNRRIANEWIICANAADLPDRFVTHWMPIPPLPGKPVKDAPEPVNPPVPAPILRMHAENLILALRVAIATRKPIDQAEFHGGTSGLVAGWEEVLATLEAGHDLTVVPFDPLTGRVS
jgi:hypothetical protein